MSDTRADLLSVIGADVDELTGAPATLSDDQLRSMYEVVILVRALDEACMRLLQAGEIGLYVSSTGLEATSVGAAFALKEGDWAFPSFRDSGIYLVRGGTLRGYTNQLFANAADVANGRQTPGHHTLPEGRFVSPSGPVGTQVVQGTGVGIAMRLRRDPHAVLVSFGEGATSQGDFHTGMNLAGIHSSPVIFLCQTQRWVAPAPRQRQSAAERYVDCVSSYGFTGTRVDGADILAVYSAVHDARARAVEGKGATFVEAVIDRYSPPQIGVDGRSDRDQWSRSRDPIGRFREHLHRRGIWEPAWEDDLIGRIQERIDDAIELARSCPAPPSSTLLDGVYADTSGTPSTKLTRSGAPGRGAGPAAQSKG